MVGVRQTVAVPGGIEAFLDERGPHPGIRIEEAS
jgi:hypothetical protein